MREELAQDGYKVDVVAINTVGGESTQQALATRCSFDLLQDVASVRAWDLMGGKKDDLFVYREGGALAPSGYLPYGGPVNTNLSTAEGYSNVYRAVVEAHDLGRADNCDVEQPPSAGRQRPGDFNQDRRLDIADVVSLLGHLLLGSPQDAPCEAGSTMSDSGRTLLDVNQDEDVDVSDAVYILNFLFVGGPPPARGTECVPIPGCPDICGL